MEFLFAELRKKLFLKNFQDKRWLMNDVNVEYHLHGIPCHVNKYGVKKLKK